MNRLETRLRRIESKTGLISDESVRAGLRWAIEVGVLGHSPGDGDVELQIDRLLMRGVTLQTLIAVADGTTRGLPGPHEQ
jgi:hypothetical protein